MQEFLSATDTERLALARARLASRYRQVGRPILIPDRTNAALYEAWFPIEISTGQTYFANCDDAGYPLTVEDGARFQSLFLAESFLPGPVGVLS